MGLKSSAPLAFSGSKRSDEPGASIPMGLSDPGGSGRMVIGEFGEFGLDRLDGGLGAFG